MVGWLEEEVWCLDSCDEPVTQFSQEESDMVGTGPTLLARIRVKFLSLVWKRLESLAMSSLVLSRALVMITMMGSMAVMMLDGDDDARW